MVEDGRTAREGETDQEQHGVQSWSARPDAPLHLQPRSDGTNHQSEPAGPERHAEGASQEVQDHDKITILLNDLFQLFHGCLDVGIKTFLISPINFFLFSNSSFTRLTVSCEAT